RSAAFLSHRGGRRSAVALHESPVYPVLQSPRPLALGGDSPLGRHGASVAQIEQGEKIALRTVWREGPPREARSHIAREHRALAPRIDARLGQIGRRDEARAISSRENVVVPNGLQRLAYFDEASPVPLEPRAVE